MILRGLVQTEGGCSHETRSHIPPGTACTTSSQHHGGHGQGLQHSHSPVRAGGNLNPKSARPSQLFITSHLATWLLGRMGPRGTSFSAFSSLHHLLYGLLEPGAV